MRLALTALQALSGISATFLSGFMPNQVQGHFYLRVALTFYSSEAAYSKIECPHLKTLQTFVK